MDFKEWWKGPFGSGYFTRKELAEAVGVPVEFRDYEADLAEAFHAARPKPSTDFSIPRGNPGTEYLLYEDGHGWFVGWWDSRRKGFYWTSHNLKGDEILSPTHWLPLPDAP